MMGSHSPDEHAGFLQGAYEQVDKRMSSFERALEALRGELAHRFDGVDRRLERRETKIDSTLRWSVGTTIFVGATLLAAIVTRMH
jgi:tRNA G37 N-methylase TrmD